MHSDIILPFLHELCTLAEQETLPRFRAPIDISNKAEGGFDPVTEADKNAELVIRNKISETFPDHGIIGEEFGSTNTNAEYCWVIDPVDGTRAFIAGIPVWGTLIGLYKDGVPYAGIMHQPVTGERYFSDGHSSHLQFNSVTSQLTAASNLSLSDAVVMTTAPEIFSSAEHDLFEKVAQKARMKRFGADCYAYCQVAAGLVGAVIETGLQIYDIAALIPIVRNAGGVFTDWEGREPNNGGRVIASANRKLHDHILELLNGNK